MAILNYYVFILLLLNFCLYSYGNSNQNYLAHNLNISIQFHPTLSFVIVSIFNPSIHLYHHLNYHYHLTPNIRHSAPLYFIFYVYYHCLFIIINNIGCYVLTPMAIVPTYHFFIIYYIIYHILHFYPSFFIFILYLLFSYLSFIIVHFSYLFVIS